MSRRVVIIGGGVAGLEALLALHDLAGDRAELTLVAPGPDFLYKPMLVDEPFDLGPVEQHALAPLAEQLGAEFVQRTVTTIEPNEHTVELDDASSLEYDFLIVATGGRFRRSPGKRENVPIRRRAAADQRPLAIGGKPETDRFVVPSGVTWALPIYEIALMTQRRALELAVEVELTIVTPEEAPLAIFGPIASTAVAELLAARGIGVEAAAHAQEGAGHELVLTPGTAGSPRTRSSPYPPWTAPRSPACLKTNAASFRSTNTRGWLGSRMSTRRGTAPTSRSNRAGLAPSRRTRPPRTSPSASAPRSPLSHSTRCYAAS